MVANEIPSSLMTVRQFAQKHAAFRVGGLRFQIFHEKENGLAKSGAVVRLGRKVLIDEVRFLDWVRNPKRAACGAR